MHRKLVLLLVTCCLLGLVPKAYSARVLMLDSHHPGYPAAQMAASGALSVFAEAGITLDIEYLDANRYTSVAYQRLFRSLLAAKMVESIPYDVIMASDTYALKFVLSNRNILFLGLPVVFFGVDDISLALRQNNDPLVTGSTQISSLLGSTELAHSLNPSIQRLVGIVSSKRDFPNISEFIDYGDLSMPHYHEVWELSSMTWKEITARLTALQGNVAVLYLSGEVDRQGKRLSADKAMETIVMSTGVPVYTLWAHFVGKGAVGGQVVNHYDQARRAALMVQSILNGIRPEDMPVNEQSLNRVTVDYNQAERFGFDLDVLPKDAVIRNQPVQVWDKYTTMKDKVFLAGCMLGVLVLAFCLCWLTRRRERRERFTLRRAVHEQRALLAESKAYMQNLIDAAPSAIFCIDSNGRLLNWNRRARSWVDNVDSLQEDASIFTLLPALPLTSLQLDRLLAGGDYVRYGRQLFSDRGGARYADVTVYPIHGGREDKALIMCEDVSHKLPQEEGLLQNAKMLTLGAIASGMAGQISSSLGSMRNMLQNISRRLDGEFAGNLTAAEQYGVSMAQLTAYLDERGILDMLGTIRGESESANELAETLANFTRKGTSSQQPADLQSVVERVITMAGSDYNVSSGYDFRKITIERNFDEALPEVLCSISEMEQAILNLLLTSARNCTAGQGKIIGVSLRQERNMVILEIQDNCVGLNADVLRKNMLAEAIHPPRSEPEEIGMPDHISLTIAYFIVTERHQGQLDVSGGGEEGICFTVILPAFDA